MDQPHTLTEDALFAHAITDIVNAISDRPGESTEQRAIRAQVATRVILDLAPRGVIEVMLAGHAVMFHAVITDSVSNTLRGEIDKMRRATRANIVAMERAFHQNLDKLKEYQTRRSEVAGEAESAPRSQETRTAPVETMPAPNDDPMPQPVPSPAIRADQPPVTEAPAEFVESPLEFHPAPASTAFMAAAHGGQTGKTIDRAATVIPFASLSSQEDTQAPDAPPQLNRAQRRQLRHGRM